MNEPLERHEPADSPAPDTTPDPVRKTVPIPPDLLAFIENEAKVRGNDPTSLMREILYRWARRHGFEVAGDAAVAGAPGGGPPMRPPTSRLEAPEGGEGGRCGGRGRWHRTKKALRFHLMGMLALLGDGDGFPGRFRGRGKCRPDAPSADQAPDAVANNDGDPGDSDE